jgi:hypothetical protein
MKWLLPELTTAQRLALTFDDRELVFDTDEKAAYIGDGVTVGGIRLARHEDIGSGFYGIILQDTDLGQTFKTDVIRLNRNDFYLHADSDGRPIINVAFEAGAAVGGVTDHGALSGLGDDDHTQYIRVDGTRAFTGDQSLGGNRLTNLGAPNTGTDAARFQDIGPGFYGIIVQDTDIGQTFKTDVIRLNRNDFYLHADSDGRPVINVSFEAALAGSGEANTASNLPGDEGVFSTKVGVDLRFKSLTAGSNVILASDANAITVSSVGGGAFYGILIKESEAGGYSEKDDEINFNSTYFYVQSNASGKPLVSFHEDQVDHGKLAGLTDDDHTQYILADGTRAFTGDQSMGGNRLTNLGTPTANTDAARLQDIGPGFYGIYFRESESGGYSERDDTLVIDSDYFYLRSNSQGKPHLSFVDSSPLDDRYVNITGDTMTGNLALPITSSGVPALTFDGYLDSGLRFDEVGTVELITVLEGTDVLRVDTNGNVIANRTYFSTYFGTEAVPTYTFLTDNNVGIYRPDPDQLGIVAGGVELLRAVQQDSGVNYVNIKNRLGVTTNSGFYLVPKSTLHVEGDGLFENGKVQAAGFYLTDGGELAKVSDIGPGFYGIIVQDTDLGQTFKTDVIRLNRDDFYLHADSDGRPIINIDFEALAAGVSDHGALTGLADDDHTQYILADGTRAFTGNQSLGSNKLTNLGAPTTGTDAARLQDIGPGFYGITIKQINEAASFSGITVIAFDNSFYVTQNTPNTDEIVVNLRGGGPAGPAGPQGPQGDPGTPGAGFYGMNVGQTDDLPLFSGIGTIKFNINNFYTTQNDPNTDEVVVNLRGVAEEDHTHPTSDIISGTFADARISESSVTQHEGAITHQNLSGAGTNTHAQIDSHIADADIHFSLSEVGPGFYGIVIEESDGSPSFRDDTIRFLASDFDLSDVNNKPQIALDPSIARLSDIGPGFYGITVKQSDEAQSFSGINVLSFETENFYLIQNSTNPDETVINFRGDKTVVAAGSNITVTRSGNTFTINADVATSDIPPGFYGITIKQSDDLQSFSGLNTVGFNTNDFYVTQNASNPDEAVVNLRSLGGAQGPQGPQGPPGPAGVGFYGITVAQTDGLAVFSGLRKLNLEARHFYVTQNAPNTDEAIINIRGVAESSHTHDASDVISGTFADARISESSVTQHEGAITHQNISGAGTNTHAQIDSHISDTDIHFSLSEVGPGFYGVIFEESDGSPSFRDDTVRFLSNDFILSEVGNKPQLALATDIARTSDIGPGFYGIVVEESDGTNTQKDDTIRFLAADFDVSNVNNKPQDTELHQTFKSDVVRFNRNDFYLHADSLGRPVVNVSFEAALAGSGEANTASNLPGDEGIFSTKVGVDLRFKSLTAGTNISLASDANAITISSTAGDGGPGFYGIIFKESQIGGGVHRDDTLVVDSDSFYLHGRPDGKPLLALHDKYVDTAGDTMTGTLLVRGDNVLAIASSSDDNTGLRWSTTDGTLEFISNGLQRASLDAQGNFTAEGRLIAAQAGTTANPGIRFDGDLNSGIYQPSTDRISIVTGGLEHLRLTEQAGAFRSYAVFASKLAIAKSVSQEPAYSLEVQGDGFFKNGKVLAAGFYSVTDGEVAYKTILNYTRLSSLTL